MGHYLGHRLSSHGGVLSHAIVATTLAPLVNVAPTLTRISHSENTSTLHITGIEASKSPAGEKPNLISIREKPRWGI
jgi:hypothetical protein